MLEKAKHKKKAKFGRGSGKRAVDSRDGKFCREQDMNYPQRSELGETLIMCRIKNNCQSIIVSQLQTASKLLLFSFLRNKYRPQLTLGHVPTANYSTISEQRTFSRLPSSAEP